MLLLLLLLNTLQAQGGGGGHENGGKVLWVKRDVLDGHTLTLQCSQRDANINTVVMKRDNDGDLVIKLYVLEFKVHIVSPFKDGMSCDNWSWPKMAPWTKSSPPLPKLVLERTTLGTTFGMPKLVWGNCSGSSS